MNVLIIGFSNFRFSDEPPSPFSLDSSQLVARALDSKYIGSTWITTECFPPTGARRGANAIATALNDQASGIVIVAMDPSCHGICIIDALRDSEGRETPLELGPWNIDRFIEGCRKAGIHSQRSSDLGCPAASRLLAEMLAVVSNDTGRRYEHLSFVLVAVPPAPQCLQRYAGQEASFKAEGRTVMKLDDITRGIALLVRGAALKAVPAPREMHDISLAPK